MLISDIDILNPNCNLLLWDNYLKIKLELSLDYCIKCKIQLLEYLAYSPDFKSDLKSLDQY